MKTRTFLISMLLALGIAGCDLEALHEEPTNRYLLKGKAEGLAGTLILRNQGYGTITLNQAGHFQFPHTLPEGAPFHITIAQNPPGQICNLSNHFGLSGATEYAPIQVRCEDEYYSVGGEVQGLNGTLVLQTQWGDAKQLKQDGSFTMSATFTMGTPYAITILSQPDTQHCAIKNARGIVSTDSITNIQVACQSRHTLSKTNLNPRMAKSDER